MLGHRARILQVDVLRSDLHIAQGGLDIGVTINCMRAGRLIPPRIMSEAKVWRLRRSRRSRHYAELRIMPSKATIAAEIAQPGVVYSA